MSSGIKFTEVYSNQESAAFSAEGVFFQFIYVDPRENPVIVKTSAFDDFWDDKLGAETWAAYRAVGNALK